MKSLSQRIAEILIRDDDTRIYLHGEGEAKGWHSREELTAIIEKELAAATEGETPAAAGTPCKHDFIGDEGGHFVCNKCGYCDACGKIVAHHTARENEAFRLLRKFVTQYHLSGLRPQKDSMNPAESLLWETQEFLDSQIGATVEGEMHGCAEPEGLREALAKLKQDFYAESIKSCMEASQTAVGFQDEHNGYCRGKQAAYEECSDRVDELLAPLPAPPSRQTNGADEVVEACAQYAEKCFSDVAEKGTCDYIAEGLRKTFKGTFTLADDERRRIAETALRMAANVLEKAVRVHQNGGESSTSKEVADRIRMINFFDVLSESRKEPQ